MIFYHKMSEGNALTDTARIFFSFFFPVAMFPFDKIMTAYGQYLDLLSGASSDNIAKAGLPSGVDCVLEDDNDAPAHRLLQPYPLYPISVLWGQLLQLTFYRQLFLSVNSPDRLSTFCQFQILVLLQEAVLYVGRASELYRTLQLWCMQHGVPTFLLGCNPQTTTLAEFRTNLCERYYWYAGNRNARRFFVCVYSPYALLCVCMCMCVCVCVCVCMCVYVCVNLCAA
jgi:hypothetical protein